MLLIIMLEGNLQVAQRPQARQSCLAWHVGDVIAPHRFHEAFGHAWAALLSDRRGQRQQANLPGEGPGLLGGVRRAVVGIGQFRGGHHGFAGTGCRQAAI